MTLNEFEQLFKSVVEAYPPAGSVHYHYGRMWDFNGMPSQDFPAVLLDRMPEAGFSGVQSKFLPTLSEFNFKVYFFDEYHHRQRDTKKWSEKQTDLATLAAQIFGELERLDREGGNFNLSYTSKFFGDIDSNNGELIELACSMKVSLKNSCDKLTFEYA